MAPWTLLLLAALNGGSAGRVAATRVVDASMAPRDLDPVVDDIRARLEGTGFHWHEEACGLQPEPIACLRALQPEAVVFATLARTDEGVVLTLADGAELVGRLGAPPGGRRLAGDLARFLQSRYPAHAAGIIRSRSPLPGSAQVRLDDRALGRAPGGERLELRRVGAGPHELRLTAPNRVSAPVSVDVTPGETREVRLRFRRLRTRSRIVHLVTAASALTAGAVLFGAGVAESNCDLLSDQPIGRCPDAFRPEVDLRIPGATVLGFGAGLGTAELLLDRKQSAWLPLLLGLAVSGASTAVAFAGF